MPYCSFLYIERKLCACLALSERHKKQKLKALRESYNVNSVIMRPNVLRSNEISKSQRNTAAQGAIDFKHLRTPPMSTLAICPSFPLLHSSREVPGLSSI